MAAFNRSDTASY